MNTFRTARSASLLAVAPLVLAAALPAHAVTSPAAHAGVRVSGAGDALSTRVVAALQAVDLGPAADIRVSSAGGVVTLAGWTATLAAREAAPRVVEALPGVAMLDVRVVTTPTHPVDDASLTSAVTSALRSAQGLGAVEASATRGAVRLSGTVKSAADRDAAVAAAKAVEGGRELDDAIRIEPDLGSAPPPPSALGSMPLEVDQENVTLSPDGRTATVRGVTFDVLVRRVERVSEPVGKDGVRTRERVYLLVGPRPAA